MDSQNNKLAALMHLGRLDAGHDDLTEDHYDKLLRDIQARREPDDSADQQRMNEEANGYAD